MNIIYWAWMILFPAMVYSGLVKELKREPDLTMPSVKLYIVVWLAVGLYISFTLHDLQ